MLLNNSGNTTIYQMRSLSQTLQQNGCSGMLKEMAVQWSAAN